MTTTTTAKPKRTPARAPIPAVEPTSGTSAVDALTAASASATTTATPNALAIAENVRRDLAIDEEFLASIRMHGVLMPVLVFELDGQLHVLDGQRRVTAAAQAGLDQVPVHVVSIPGEDAKRIIAQLAVNDHRTALSDAEHVAAYEQLELLGLDVESIAQQTQTASDVVAKGLRVARSPIAADAIQSLPITLEQAAYVAELEEEPELVEQVLAAAADNPKQLGHVIASARLEHQVRVEKRNLIAELEQAGYPIVLDEPRSTFRPTAEEAEIDDLFKDADRKTPLASSSSQRLKPTTPGIVAYVYTQQSRYNYELGRYESDVKAKFTVRGWRELGYLVSEYNEEQLSGKGTGSGKTDAEIEAEKAKRRAVIANNKAWVAATGERLKWIEQFLTGKDEPAGWAANVVRQIDRSGFQREISRTEQLLGAGHGMKALTKLVDKDKTRAPFVLIALAIADVEASFEFAKSGWRSELAKAHLKQLAAWGYTLSEIEESVVKGTVAGK